MSGHRQADLPYFRTLRSILLMVNLDVVPVEPSTEERWQENPLVKVSGRCGQRF